MKSEIYKVTAIVVTIFSFISCSSKNKALNAKELQTHKNAYEMYNLIQQDNYKKQKAIEKFVSSLSIEEKISQIFMINLEKDDKFFPVEWYDRVIKNSDGSESKIKTTLIPAGYIFFGYNVSKNPETIIGFTDSILEKAYSENSIAPFLSIDVEGGFVNRLRGVAGPLPENERVSQCLNTDEAFELYSLYAKQLNSLGFSLNLAPVAEIGTEKNQDFLSGRSYGNLENVKKFCGVNIKAYQTNNVGTVLKHFPGNTNIDPHIGLPKIEMTDDEFLQIKDAFAHLLTYNPDGVLMSHAIVPSYDKDPACLSKFWITDVIRNDLKYDGIVFSDDIFMGALIDNGYSPAVASKMAVEAGINCIMISEKKFGKWMNLLINICEDDPEFLKKIEDSVCKMISFKIRRGLLYCEYDKKNDIYTILSPDLNEIINNPNIQKKRFENFSEAKNKTLDFYNKYFLTTASDEEKRGLFIN